MLSACAKSVEWAGKQHGKASAIVSTHSLKNRYVAYTGRVKPLFVTTFIPMFPLPFSPLKIANSPLVEHYFYPVSTVPIINRNQINSKKGSK
jgi:hypothetical protein